SSRAFNGLSQMSSQTDQLGRVTTYQYDAAGNLTEVTEPAVPDPSANGALVSPVYHYALDSFGNVGQSTDPLGRTTSYTYDNNGQQLSETLPGGQTQSATYN